MGIESIIDILPNWLKTVPGDIPSQAKHHNNFGLQLVLSSFIGTLSFLLFCFLRLNLPSLYAPRTKLLSQPINYYESYFGWIVPLIKISEEEFLDKCGLDAYMVNIIYLRFRYYNFLKCR